MYKRFIFIISMVLCCLFIFQHTSAWATSSQSKELKSLQNDLQVKAKETRQLKQDIKTTERSLKSAQRDLSKLGKSIHMNERTLRTLDSSIVNLEKQRSALNKTLKTNQNSFSDLVLSLQRITRTPPEAMILKPGAPINTARSAMLMEGIMSDIQNKTNIISRTLKDLDESERDLMQKKDRAVDTRTSLSKKKTKLATLLQKRKTLYELKNKDLETQEVTTKKIAEKASDLKNLMSKLKAARTANLERRVQNKKTVKQKKLPRLGDAQLPVTGDIRVKYNQKDDLGAKSKGLKISAPANGLVVAPMGGIIRFAGVFRNYGNMVIVEHKGGYHSLVAGLKKIDTVVGQNVLAGEPIGKLKNTPSLLYYELRKNGQSVNPNKKLKI